jgi:NADH-quinone oxidoreductase subunit L
MGGLRRRMPWTTVAFAAGALSLAGLPGLAGFFSKDLVLASVEGRLAWLPYALLLATAFVTAFYMGRVLFGAFFGAPRGKAAEHAAHEPGVSMLLPLAILVVPAIALGWLGAPLASFAGSAERVHFGATAALASALGLVGLGLAWRARAGTSVTAPLERFAARAAVNRLYLAIYRRVVLAGAAVMAWIDRYLVDGLMNGAGAATLAGGRALRRLQTGRAADGVLAVVIGALIFAAWGLLP